ncbi:MAG TPA: flagellar export protein FliJ [Burkholderiaceae bacterium]|nr:flagellar export protein FliJ [Burkholderiaceae bacterium]
MNGNTSLQTALELAEKERDAAFARCQQLAQALERQRSQAQQLATYRADYQQRWSHQFQREGTMEILRCYRDFMGRLEQALGQQDLVVQHAERQLEQARCALLAHEQRVGAIRKMLERRAAEATAAARRREQQHTDEQASRLAWQQRRDAGGAFATDFNPLPA